MIKNIIFDLGNVLVPIDVNRPRKELLKILKNPISNAHKAMKVIQKYEIGAVSTAEFINGLLRLSEYDAQAYDVVTAWNSVFLDIPAESIDLLLRLKKNYSVFILSNTNELHIEFINKQLLKKFQYADLNMLVNKAFYSHELKDRKPHKSIYKTVLNKENLQASESVFLDDLKENVLAASACGLHTIHVKDFKNTESLLKKFLNKDI